MGHVVQGAWWIERADAGCWGRRGGGMLENSVLIFIGNGP